MRLRRTIIALFKIYPVADFFTRAINSILYVLRRQIYEEKTATRKLPVLAALTMYNSSNVQLLETW